MFNAYLDDFPTGGQWLRLPLRFFGLGGLGGEMEDPVQGTYSSRTTAGREEDSPGSLHGPQQVG